MRWVDQDPELPFQAVDTLPERTGIPVSIATSMPGNDSGLLVIISDRVRQSVLAHVAGDRNERGGLLLGEVFTTEGSRDPAHSRAVAVTSAIAAEAFSSSVRSSSPSCSSELDEPEPQPEPLSEFVTTVL